MLSTKKKRKITINFNSKSSTILCDFFESISSLKTKIKLSFPELNSKDFNILYNNTIISLDSTLQNYKQNEFFIQIPSNEKITCKENKIICNFCENNSEKKIYFFVEIVYDFHV